MGDGSGGAPLVNVGISGEEYLKAIHVVTDNARGGTDVGPSPTWLKALDEIEKPTPAYEPMRQGHGFQARKVDGPVDIGAYESVKAQ